MAEAGGIHPTPLQNKAIRGGVAIALATLVQSRRQFSAKPDPVAPGGWRGDQHRDHQVVPVAAVT
ncbi:hypothetical protein [Kribbella sp. NPDC049584]|uniref:hypothetical protein n=1 Tax=Kribbella sp. NPDC049584 TaxID=3154833 RepID=UPI00343D1042